MGRARRQAYIDKRRSPQDVSEIRRRRELDAAAVELRAMKFQFEQTSKALQRTIRALTEAGAEMMESLESMERIYHGETCKGYRLGADDNCTVIESIAGWQRTVSKHRSVISAAHNKYNDDEEISPHETTTHREQINIDHDKEQA